MIPLLGIVPKHALYGQPAGQVVLAGEPPLAEVYDSAISVRDHLAGQLAASPRPSTADGTKSVPR